MKNILFATTALVATAGIASADVSLSGLANVGIASDEGADYTVYSEVELDVALSAETDSGLTLSASVDLNVGEGFDMDDDMFDENDGIASLGAVSVTGGFGTLTFDKDGVDDQYDDASGNHDVSYAYSVGDITVGVTFDVDDATADTDGDDLSTLSATFGYTMGDMSLTVTGNNGDDASAGTVATVGYTVSEALSVSVEYDASSFGDTDAVTTFAATYAAGDLTFTADADDADGWSAGVAYAAGATSFGASTDSADEWEVTGAYDLGGASIQAGFKHTDSAFLGLAMAF